MGSGKTFYIDIVDRCNLTCPTCPNGNSPSESKQKLSFMAEPLFASILEKIRKEASPAHIGLYNWTEPFLHPELPQLIRMVKRFGFSCTVSSNFNHVHDLPGVLASGLDCLSISVSGFDQEEYGESHRGGRADRVRENLRALRDCRAKFEDTPRIILKFHRYSGRAGDESRWRKLAEALNFEFMPVWAFIAPVELILSFVQDGRFDPESFQSEHPIARRLVLPIDQTLALCRRYRHLPCTLRGNPIAIGYTGRVSVCCASFNPAGETWGGYLDMTYPEIQRGIQESPLCARCMEQGLHVYYTNRVPEFNVQAAVAYGAGAAVPGARLGPGEDRRREIGQRVRELERQMREGTPVVLFGAGSLGREVLRVMEKGRLRPLAFFDNDSGQWGNIIDGVPVQRPHPEPGQLVLITSVYRNEITRQLRGLGFPLQDILYLPDGFGSARPRNGTGAGAGQTAAQEASENVTDPVSDGGWRNV